MPARSGAAGSLSATNGTQGGSGTSTPSRYASRTAFEGLAVEGNDDDDDEEDEEEEEETAEDEPDKPLTRSAKKRAQKLAREEKRKVSKAAKAGPNAGVTRDSEGVLQAAIEDSRPPSQILGGSATVPNDLESPARNTRAASAAASNAESSNNATETISAPFKKVAQMAETTAAPMSRQSSATAAGAKQAPKPMSVTIADKARDVADKAKDVADKAKDVAATVTGTGGNEKTAEEKKAYWKKVYERTFYTFLMIGGFIALLLLGHPYMILLVMVIQTVVYREVTGLFNLPGRPHVTGGSTGANTPSVGIKTPSGGNIPDEDYFEIIRGRRREELWSKTLSWYFFTVANYFLYGESMIYYFKHIVFVDAYFIPFARHHRFLSFMLYVFGFMAFILNLRRENLKRQFGLFCWVHMSLLLIVVSSHFLVNNILEGLIWFYVPASLVICNDIFAYVCGMMFGRTPLISLSPKKTMEGFLGAFVITVLFSFGWASFFQRFNYLTCPAVSLGMNAFKDIQCELNPVFLWHSAPLPAFLSHPISAMLAPFTGGKEITSLPYTPFQLHSLVMAAFASLVAPFGGFFASGFKRAFNVKDFGDSIPGHGGLTDRFDCQFLMGLFAYVYYSSLIREHHVTVGSVLQTVVTHLTLDDQVQLYREVGKYLHGQGIKFE